MTDFAIFFNALLASVSDFLSVGPGRDILGCIILLFIVKYLCLLTFGCFGNRS